MPSASESARELLEMLPDLRQLAHQPQQRRDETGRPATRHAETRTPWRNPLMDWTLNVGHTARNLRWTTENLLFGSSPTQPLTDAAADRAINQLPLLAAYATASGHTTVADHIARQLHAWARQARRFLDCPKPGEKSWSPAPGGLTCPQCENPLWLAPGWDISPDKAFTYCRANECKTQDGMLRQYAPNVWLAKLQEQNTPADDALVSAKQAEGLLNIRANTVNQWVKRNRINRVPAPGGKPALYRYADLKNLVKTPA